WKARLDDGRDERRKLRRRPAAVLRQLGMDEVEAVEGMLLVLDTSVHVRPAARACVALNGRLLVDDLELVAVSGHRQLLRRNPRHHGEQRAVGLPAFGASAYVVESRVALQGDGHGRGTAVAGERAAGEIALASLDAAIDGRMNRCSHDVLLVRL